MNGPGTWTGENREPVNAPQSRKMTITEMIEAYRLGRTALSSPKVTVLRAVKSLGLWLRVAKPTMTIAAAKSAM